MRKMLVLGLILIISFTTVACSNSSNSKTESDQQENQPETPVETEPKQELNVTFDPETITVGEKVGLMVLEEISVTPKTSDYPYTIFEAVFSGTIIAKGILKRTAMDDEFFPDSLFFTPDEESAKLFPKTSQDDRYVWMVLTNKNDVLRDIDLKNNEEKVVEIELEGYVVRYLPTDAANTSIYDGLIN